MPEIDMDATGEVQGDLLYEQLSAKLAAANETISQLTVAVSSNRDIGAAVGILMAFRQVTQEEAFDLLRQTSQHLHIKLRELARQVIETGVLPGLVDDRPAVRAPMPTPPDRPQLDARPRHSLHGRVLAALHKADLRDAAAAARSAASRARGQAAEFRYESASRREATGDLRANGADRQSELEDRQAEALDNLWTSRDGEEAANDRALLSEASADPPTTDG
jgi:hypothetical protein